MDNIAFYVTIPGSERSASKRSHGHKEEKQEEGEDKEEGKTQGELHIRGKYALNPIYRMVTVRVVCYGN
jgi:hypothetical protein